MRHPFLLLAAVALLACGDATAPNHTAPPTDSPPNGPPVSPPPPVAAQLLILAGDAQSGAVATRLPTALTVRVLDAAGRPVSAQRVAFGVLTGGGTLDADTVSSDAAGQAAVFWTLGTVVGDSQRVVARLVGRDVPPTTFRATPLASAPATVVRVGLDAVVGRVATPLADSLRVRVLDAYGNGVPGITVAWTAPDGGTVAAATTQTDSAGRAATAWTLGTRAGVQTLTASVASLVPARFRADARPGPPAQVLLLSGVGQVDTTRATLLTPVVVRVVDRFGNVTPDIDVSFTVDSAGGARAAPARARTDSAGQARAAWTLPDARRAVTTVTMRVDVVDAAGLALGPVATLTATAVSPYLEEVVQVVAGGQFSCALTAARRTYCWGVNGQGQVGDGTTVQRNVATPITDDPGFVSLGAGMSHACGLTAAGQTYCWGPDPGGAYNGLTIRFTTRPTFVANAPPFTSIATGVGFTCGLAADGQVWCWGTLIAATAADYLSPRPVSGTLRFRTIATMAHQMCGIATNDRTYCFEGSPITVQRSQWSPTEIAVPARLLGVAVTLDQACGWTAAGATWCWKVPLNARMGPTDSFAQSVPTSMPPGVALSGIGAGWDALCGALAGPAIACWGNDSGGQLGHVPVPFEQNDVPRMVSLPGGLRLSSLHGGSQHMCGLGSDARTYCWGSVGFGALGSGGKANSEEYWRTPGAPVRVR